MATGAVSNRDYVETTSRTPSRPTTAGGWAWFQDRPPDQRRLLPGRGLAGVVDIRTARETFAPKQPNAPATTARVAEWLGSVRATLDRLGSLGDGWDSYRGSPINPRAAEAVLSVLTGVADWDTPEPSVVPTSIGGVQVEWHRNGLDLELEVMPSGDAFGLFFCDAGTGHEEERELVADLGPFAEALQVLTQRGRQPEGR